MEFVRRILRGVAKNGKNKVIFLTDSDKDFGHY